MPAVLTDASDSANWLIALCAGGSFIGTAALLQVALLRIGPWAREQVLEDPARRIRPMRWLVSVAVVALLAFFFDKIDVSRVLEGESTPGDITFSSLMSVVGVFYGYALFFLWSCETAIESEVSTLRRDVAIKATTYKQAASDRDNERRLAERLSQIIGERWKRLTALMDAQAPITIDDVANALNPDHQVSLAIVGIYDMVRSHFSGGLEPSQQLRVAYYEPDAGYLRCVVSYDGRKANCIKEPDGALHEYFKLDSERATRCLAVFCSLNGPLEPFMIGDAAAANLDLAIPYQHLSTSQANHIKSIAGFSCRRAGVDVPPHSVLTLDSTQRGFFEGTQAKTLALRRILDEFSFRLAYERDVQLLIDLMRNSSEMAKETAQ